MGRKWLWTKAGRRSSHSAFGKGVPARGGPEKRGMLDHRGVDPKGRKGAMAAVQGRTLTYAQVVRTPWCGCTLTCSRP